MLTPFSPIVSDRMYTNDAGHVFVGGVEHVLADLGVDVDAFDLDESAVCRR